MNAPGSYKLNTYLIIFSHQHISSSILIQHVYSLALEEGAPSLGEQLSTGSLPSINPAHLLLRGWTEAEQLLNKCTQYFLISHAGEGKRRDSSFNIYLVPLKCPWAMQWIPKTARDRRQLRQRYMCMQQTHLQPVCSLHSVDSSSTGHVASSSSCTRNYKRAQWKNNSNAGIGLEPQFMTCVASLISIWITESWKRLNDKDRQAGSWHIRVFHWRRGGHAWLASLLR